MSFQMDVRTNRTVVRLAGVLNKSAGQRLMSAIETLLLDSMDCSALPLVLDCAALEDVDVDGITVLRQVVSLGRKCGDDSSEAENEESIRIANPSQKVQRKLADAGLLVQYTGWRERLCKLPGSPLVESDYGAVLRTLRDGFPAPEPDAKQDAYLSQLVSHGLDIVNGYKKCDLKLGGEDNHINYEHARSCTLGENMASVESVISELAEYFEGMPLWGHEMVQANVVPPASIPSVMGYLYSTLFNPNLIWDEYSYKVSEAEVELSAMCAELVGYDPKLSSGITTWGGTGTNFYGIRLGIEKALPNAFTHGVRQEVKLFSSAASHYSKLNALGWLGVGTRNLVTVPVDEDNSMRIDLLEKELRKSLEAGDRIACILPTLGTTDSFGLDNLERIYHLREEVVKEYNLDYVPHIHADAVIGWAWAVFNDYDFSENPMHFPRRTLRSLLDVRSVIRTLHLADSIGIDFHKTGYAPYLSSLFLVKNKDDFELIARDRNAMPYLFQFGNYHPGIYTMESSRGSGAALSALANLKFFGKQGYRALLGYTVTIAESLRMRLEQSPYGVVVNDHNHGPVTLFRVYPDAPFLPDGNIALLEHVESNEKDTKGVQRVTPMQLWHNEAYSKEYAEVLAHHNAFNRRVFDIMHDAMTKGECLALSLTENYRSSAGGVPVLALKSFVMTPFVSEDAMIQLMHCLEKARKQAMAELRS